MDVGFLIATCPSDHPAISVPAQRSTFPPDDIENFLGLRSRFREDHSCFVAAASRTSHVSPRFTAMGREYTDYRKMWRLGISTLHRLKSQAPSSVEESLSFLHVANAMRRSIQHSKPAIGSEDCFLEDLNRWRLTVAEHEQDLETDAGPAADFDLAHFQRLAFSLIDHTGVSTRPLPCHRFGGYRLRTVHSAYGDSSESRSYGSSPAADLEPPGLRNPEDNRGFTEEAPCGSTLVIFLMAGAIFAIVVMFLTIRRDCASMPYDMGTLVNESYDTTDYFVYSILLPVVFDAPVGIPRQLWHDVVSAINSGQITTYSGLDAMLTSGVTAASCTERDISIFRRSLWLSLCEFGRWLAGRTLRQSCSRLEEYLGVSKRPCSSMSAGTYVLGPTDDQHFYRDEHNIVSEGRSQPAPETSSTPSSFSAQQNPSSEGSPGHGSGVSGSAAPAKRKRQASSELTSGKPKKQTSSNPAAGFSCAMCAKTYTTTSNLNRHVRIAHNGEDQHPCHFRDRGCTKILKTSWYRIEHQRNRCASR